MTIGQLYQWANAHDVSLEAVQSLLHVMGLEGHLSIAEGATSEAGATQRLRMAVAQQGGLLWRNNVGAMKDDNGRVVRYGLANESKQMNRQVKSSDLIGITPTVVTPGMVGHTLGVFTAVEMKAPGWCYSGTDREQAQKKFHELVISRGGIGRFSCGD